MATINTKANPMDENGSGGNLGSWDVIGKTLDKGNPYLDKNNTNAQKVLEEAAKLYNIPVPELQKLALQNPTWLEDLKASTVSNPADVQYNDAKTERADLNTVDGTAFDSISTDPRLQEQQMASLGALKDLAASGGMTDMDKANMSRSQSENAQADTGRRDAIMQGMARRGMGGSGNELLAQLQSSQAATDRSAQQGLDINGMAQQRALDAMMRGGDLAGSIRGQQFGEKAQVANARDAISKFNSANANSNSQFNASAGNNMNQFNTGNQLATDTGNRDTGVKVGMFNANQTQDANKYNNTGRQGTADAGVMNNNKATAYNTTELPKAQWEIDHQHADDLYKGQKAIADGLQEKAKQKEKKAGGVLGAVGSMVSDERAKKDIKPTKDIDLDMFLATIQPKKFKYKDTADGEGDRTGVMAQDLLRSKLGSEAVLQQEDGKLGYDSDKMQGIILATLKHLSNKIDGKKG